MYEDLLTSWADSGVCEGESYGRLRQMKLRVSDVYYPGEIETYYKLVWHAVDKQIFIDNTIEGAVEKRL